MKRELLEFLVCPDCQGELSCEVFSEDESGIIAGKLHCPACEQVFPIRDEIPRFITTESPLQGENKKTADAFGWEWQKFSELHDIATYEKQFLDWIHPIQPEFFRDKTVLDAGCGMGRFSLVSSHFGAKNVLAIDASDAVEAARENARDFPNVHVIQADILNLPLRRRQDAQMDFAFSIGVLHHMDNPKAGFTSLAQHLHSNGSIFAWVYGRENNGWLVNVINPLRTRLTSRLPRQLLYRLSWLITLWLHPLVCLVYRPINNYASLKWFRRLLIYNEYLTWLSQFSFHHNHHVVFDHLVAPVAYYLRREEFVEWFKENNLEIIDISWRNRNSWRGHGRSSKTG
jgi:uncharacterized protein YbaR (Trm112 family)/ubiquinone/menaquinone biosynthesis C-methylase UbiE